MATPKFDAGGSGPGDSTPRLVAGTGGGLASASAGGSGGGGMDVPWTAYVDAKISEVRAQSDTAIGKVESRVENLTVHIDSQFSALSARITTKWTTWGAALTIGGLVLAALAWGGDRFDGGVQVTATSLEYVVAAKAIASENAEQIRVITASMGETNQRLDEIIAGFERPRSDGGAQ